MKIKQKIKQNKKLFFLITTIKYFIPNLVAFFLFKFNNYQVPISKFKNKYLNERCFIIGNGPSLDLSRLIDFKGEYTFASNNFLQITKQTGFKPSFYVAQDPLFIKQNFKALKEINYENVFLRFFNIKYYFNSFKYFLIDNNNYFRQKKPGFSIDVPNRVYDGYNVSYTMIQLAVFMGFKEIYLIGIDMNYKISNGLINSESYYKGFSSKHKSGLPDIEYSLRAFDVAREMSNNHDWKIFNLSNVSIVKSFEKASINEVLEKTLYKRNF